MAHPVRRTMVVIARAPALADHRGMRWLLNGRVMPGGAIALVTHRGRRTGKTYRRPVEALLERGDEIVVTPMRGERSDWYRNVLAGGLVQVRFRGKTFERIDWRELSEEERRDVLALYRAEHPIFGRMIVWGMGRAHREAGDRIAAAAKAGPLLALTLR